MTLNDYQQAAMRTNTSKPYAATLQNAALGLAGEAGEVADMVKKHIYHDKPLSMEDLIYELGDVLWYVAQAAEAIGVRMDTIADMNIKKLLDRYPDAGPTMAAA